jgi:hypothetical protein
VTTQEEGDASGGSPLADADLYIVGASIAGWGDVSAHAREALARSRRIFGFADTSWLRQAPDVGPRLMLLEYPPVAPRAEIMRRAALEVITGVARTPPVSFVTMGSPIRHVWLSAILRRWALRERLRVRTVLGISSLDYVCLAADVEDSAGLQLFDASHLLAYGQRPDSRSHCFIFNVENTLMQRSAVCAVPRQEMFAPLRDRLLRFYPPEHVVSFVLVATPSCRDRTIALPLSELSAAAGIHPLGTLYVPPVERPPESGTVAACSDLSVLVSLSSSPLDDKLSELARQLLTRL